MTTKKKIPLLMSSEDDIYDPQLLETIQFCHQNTEDSFEVPRLTHLNAKYDSYHLKTVRWMVDIENRNCKLIVNTYLYYIIITTK